MLDLLLSAVGYPVGRIVVRLVSFGTIIPGPFTSRRSFGWNWLRRTDDGTELEPEIVGYIGFASLCAAGVGLWHGLS